MEVALKELIIIIKDLLDNKTNRKVASEKVFKYYNFENRILFNLKFKPEKSKEIIWKTIEFIYVIDDKVSPLEYFYSIQDVKDF